MSTSVTLEGADELRRTLADLSWEAKRSAQLEVRRRLARIQAGAQRRCPVRSGRLRDSITYEFNEDATGGDVFTDVEYGVFVEFGTSRMPAQPFLFPAFEEEREAFIQGLREEFTAGFRRALG